MGKSWHFSKDKDNACDAAKKNDLVRARAESDRFRGRPYSISAGLIVTMRSVVRSIGNVHTFNTITTKNYKLHVGPARNSEALHCAPQTQDWNVRFRYLTDLRVIRRHSAS